MFRFISQKVSEIKIFRHINNILSLSLQNKGQKFSEKSNRSYCYQYRLDFIRFQPKISHHSAGLDWACWKNKLEFWVPWKKMTKLIKMELPSNKFKSQKKCDLALVDVCSLSLENMVDKLNSYWMGSSELLETRRWSSWPDPQSRQWWSLFLLELCFVLPDFERWERTDGQTPLDCRSA